MRNFFLSSASVLLLGAAANPVHAQSGSRPTPALDGTPPVFAMAEAEDFVRVTVGHSKLLTAAEPFETVIVGDDTIANATVGPGNSLILTGLAAGATNVIVRGEEAGTLLASTIVVVPAEGPLRSTVTVLKGSQARDRYECRGSACALVAAEDSGSEVPLFLLSSAPDPEAAPAGDDAAAGEPAR